MFEVVHNQGIVKVRCLSANRAQKPLAECVFVGQRSCGRAGATEFREVQLRSDLLATSRPKKDRAAAKNSLKSHACMFAGVGSGVQPDSDALDCYTCKIQLKNAHANRREITYFARYQGPKLSHAAAQGKAKAEQA